MFRNCFYNGQKSEIHLWEEINGSKKYTTIPWVPYFYQKTESKTGIKTLDGFNVKKRKFNTHKQFLQAQKESINIYENNVLPVIQFLSENYADIPDDNLISPKLKIYSIDIEVHSEQGFPHAELAEYPITVINLKEFNGKSYSWGLKPYTKEFDLQDVNGNNIDIEYCYHYNEPDLLKSFILWFNRHPPDVLTGWNIMSDTKTNKFGGFDMPYIINRCIQLFGENTNIYKKLSPINNVRKWIQKNTNTMIIDIAGISIIDYMSLYKWYTPKNQENFRLDTICQDELNIGKLEYEYEDLRELYNNDWNTYIDYNIIDNVRIEELENKLGYIKLAQQLSLLTKTPIKSYNASVQQIEGLLLTYYRRNKLCAPYFAGGTQEHFPAAYVKTPQKGIHNWVIDVDIASSYPTSIIIMNMSPETYIGRIQLNEDKIVKYCKQKRFDEDFTLIKTTGISKMKNEKLKDFNNFLNNKLITIAPCGTVFDNTKKGVYASVEKSVFFKRKEIKRKMIDIKKSIKKIEKKNPTKASIMKENADRLFSYQWALKIVLNQAFGILAVPYSRYFNTDIAEAITSASKYTIIHGQTIVNRLFNNPNINSDFNSELKKIIKQING